jgi:hypothetical protein
MCNSFNSYVALHWREHKNTDDDDQKIQWDSPSATVDLKKACDSLVREVLYNILTKFSILQN